MREPKYKLSETVWTLNRNLKAEDCVQKACVTQIKYVDFDGFSGAFQYLISFYPERCDWVSSWVKRKVWVFEEGHWTNSPYQLFSSKEKALSTLFKELSI